MNFGLQFFILGAVVGTFTVMITLCEADDTELELIDCKKVMARIAKRTLKAFGQCTKELRSNLTEQNKDQFESKLGCAIRCTLSRMDILDDGGKVTVEKTQKFMDEMVPKDAHDFAHALTADCNESYGLKLDPNQEFCESYSEYAQCMQSTLADFADKTSCHPGGRK